MEYTELLQEVSEHLTNNYNEHYTKAMDGTSSDANDSQETCRMAIQNYLSKQRKLPDIFKNEKTVDNLFNDCILWGVVTPLIKNGVNEGISEIRMYGGFRIEIQQDGKWKRLDNLAYRSEEAFQNVVNRILSCSDISMNDMNGFTDRASLPTGERVMIVQSPFTSVSNFVSIRIYNKDLFSSDELVSIGAVSPLQDKLLKFFMGKARANSFFMGPNTAGKTTTLGAYLPHLPKECHILTIEDKPEFYLSERNPDLIVSEFYVKEGDFALTWSKASSLVLRSAADIVFWGELRDGISTYRAVENMTTGQRGSGSTGHAGNAAEGIKNLANRYQEVMPNINENIVLQRVAGAIDFIPISRKGRSGNRYLGDISAIGWNPVKKEPLIVPIIKRRENKDGSLTEEFMGIPDFLKQRLIDWNYVFEEDFEEWSI